MRFAEILLILFGFAAAPSVFAQNFKVIHTFSGATDGAYPAAGLVQDSSGDLYGTTSYGTNKAGTLFKLSSSGKFNILHRFGNGLDGARPFAALIRIPLAICTAPLQAAACLVRAPSSSLATMANTACSTTFPADQMVVSRSRR